MKKKGNFKIKVPVTMSTYVNICIRMVTDMAGLFQIKLRARYLLLKIIMKLEVMNPGTAQLKPYFGVPRRW